MKKQVSAILDPKSIARDSRTPGCAPPDCRPPDCRPPLYVMYKFEFKIGRSSAILDPKSETVGLQTVGSQVSAVLDLKSVARDRMPPDCRPPGKSDSRSQIGRSRL